MAAAAILDFIKVPFLCRGWAHFHQIWYAGVERYHVVESVAKKTSLQNEMAAAAILDFGKIAITSLRIDGFGSNVVCMYKNTLNWMTWPKMPFNQNSNGGGRHFGFYQVPFLRHQIWYARAEWHPVLATNFVCRYKKHLKLDDVTNEGHLTKIQDGGGSHLEFCQYEN